jgi:hypothetical protein
MNDTELDALLSAPLPERDAGEFSVRLMERITRDRARPARILSWITVGMLFVAIAAASLFGASLIGRGAMGSAVFAIPAALSVLTLLLSYTVLQSARE